MASSNDVAVDIDVLACDKCSPHGNDYSCLRPGNSLEGQIRVLSPSALLFTDIEISFQGNSGYVPHFDYVASDWETH
jgi:hypothetical protein